MAPTIEQSSRLRVATTAELLTQMVETLKAEPLRGDQLAECCERLATTLRQRVEQIVVDASAATGHSREHTALLFEDTLRFIDGLPLLVAQDEAKLRLENEQIAKINDLASIAYKPLGKVLIVIPANAPLPLAIALPFAFIAAGNEVIVAASSGARDFVLRISELFEERIRESLAIWAGPVRDAVSALVPEHIVDALYFMGSSDLLPEISGKAAAAGVSLIYEGEGRGIAFLDEHQNEDTIKRAAAALALSKYMWKGGMCSAPNVVMVPKESASAFRKAFEQASAMHTFDLRISALLSPQVQQFLREASATYANFGQTVAQLLDAASLDRALQKEIFGPVLLCVVYETRKEALRWISSSRFLLQFSIFSEDKKGIEEIVARTRFSRYCINMVPSLQDPLLLWGNQGLSGISPLKNFFQKARTKAIVETRLEYGVEVDSRASNS